MARIRLRLSGRQRGRAAARGPGLSRRRQDRRSGRERRGARRQPRHRHVHLVAHVLRAFPAAQRGRRGRAPLPRGGRRPAQRVLRLLRGDRLPPRSAAHLRLRIRPADAQEPFFLFSHIAPRRTHADRIDGGRQSRLHVPCFRGHPLAPRADHASSGRAARSHSRLDVQDVGRSRGVVRRPLQRSAHSRRRSAEAGGGAHQGALRPRGQDARHLRRSRAAHALRGARVRYLATSHGRARSPSLAAGATAKTRRR